MPYRLREKMPETRYFDIIDELIMKWIMEHIEIPCDLCKDQDITSSLCDECSINKHLHGKDSIRIINKENTDD